MGKRVVRLRTGIVLSRKGGALPSFLRPIRLGIAAILGSGKQAISWIHIDDLCRLYQQAIENPAMKGAYNAVAPHPVSNKAFTIALAKEFKGRFFLPIYIPSFLLKIFLGEMSIEVLKSATVSCEKIKQTGFIFQFPEIEARCAPTSSRLRVSIITENYWAEGVNTGFFWGGMINCGLRSGSAFF